MRSHGILDFLSPTPTGTGHKELYDFPVNTIDNDIGKGKDDDDDDAVHPYKSTSMTHCPGPLLPLLLLLLLLLVLLRQQ